MKAWTIGKRITAGIGVLVLITFALGAYSIHHVREIRDDANTITTDCLPGVYLICKIDAALKSSELEVREHILNTDAAEMQANEKAIADMSSAATRAYEAYEKTITAMKTGNCSRSSKPPNRATSARAMQSSLSAAPARKPRRWRCSNRSSNRRISLTRKPWTKRWSSTSATAM